MPVGTIDLDPREVLEHLNELGYTNITPSQLKAFVKDLKKLIYYDLSKQERIRMQDVAPQSTCYESSDGTSQKPCTCPPVTCKDTTTSTSSSCRRFVNPDAQDHPRVLTDDLERFMRMSENIEGRFQRKHDEPPRCSRIPSHYPDENQPCHLPHPESSNTCGSVDVCDIPPRCPVSETESSHLPMRPEMVGRRDPLSNKPSSFIRPAAKIKSSKCDPVALYQYYQNKWSQFRLPGEDPHANLRWRVRHKMMGTHSATSSCVSQDPSNRKVFRTIQP